MDIRKLQTERALSMLNYNTSSQPEWKFIIYDNIGEDIVTNLLPVKELKYHGVTLRLLIDSSRDSVQDVSAIYFLMPTDDNINRICKDISDNLYDSYYLNFISSLPRPKLETIANAALNSQSAISIKKVYSQYLDFIALESDFFILRESDKQTISYQALNKTDATDEDITTAIDYIVEGVFSLLVLLKAVPIIRCQRGGPAELVGQKLDARIRSTLTGTNKSLLENEGIKVSRPLLCLVDRTVDMTTPLHHSWTYQSLIHDLLNTKLNTVKIIDYDDAKTPKAHIFDLDPKDKFWRHQRGSPFPQVADAVQRELDEHKKCEDEVTSNFDGVGDLLSDSSKPRNARSLMELRENKRIIAMHTSIATSVLDEIKARKLDSFFELEERIMNRNPVDRVLLDDMLTNPEYGQPSDKSRLFLISYICNNPKLSDEEAEKYAHILEQLGCERTAFDYIRNWRNLSNYNMDAVQSEYRMQSNLQPSEGILKTAGMFTKLMSQGSQFVMEGVKNLVLKEHHLPLTKIVDSLMNTGSRTTQESLRYTYLDPCSDEGSDVTRQKSFQSAIVFVVGGGNYIEHQNLVEYSRSKSRNAIGFSNPKHVIYGSTELVNANQFLQQLELLGKSLNSQLTT